MLGEAWIADRSGGLNRYSADLSANLDPKALAARLVVIGPAVNAPPAVIAASSAAERLPARLLRYRRATLSTSGVDVVDAHFALYAFLPIFTTRLGRLPLVVHFQGPWADESMISRGNSIAIPIKRAVERAVYRRARRVVVLSKAFGRVVSERYGVDPALVVVIPPGVDHERFSIGDANLARERLDLPRDAFVVAAARRLDGRMGLDSLLAAWDVVSEKQRNAVLVIAGDGIERGALERQRLQLARPESVRFLGRVSDDELVQLYQAADCSVVPTRSLEGFGLVVLESLACGTPAIVTNVGGLPEAVEELDPSLVIEPEDPEALAARILAAARGDVPSRIACRAHAQRFNWADVARRHIALYEEVARGVSKNTRVVFIDHCARLSGGELALVRMLSALDVDAHVILGEDGPLVERLERAGISVEVLPMPAVSRDLHRDQVRPRTLPFASAAASLSYSVKLAGRLRKLRPDIVHTNSLKSALYGGLAGRLARKPVVWHVRDRIADDYMPGAAVRMVKVARRLLPAAVIANSNETLSTLGGEGGWAVPSPIIIHDSAVISAAFGSRSGGSLTVGMVGRLAPWKGQHVFLEAFARAFDQGPERAVIVGEAMFGEDAYSDELRSQVIRLGIEDRVEFKGFVDDVEHEYERIDVLVHASTIPEPFGQVVVEGMAAGLPVVAANAGGPAEVITDGVDGWLFPMGDVAALATRLRTLADEPARRQRLGAAARQRALDFSPQRVAEQVLSVYHSVLRR
jgi:glycosyltransferase involved in cell wall biosynthesis